jgi:hypothetical protein
MELAFFDLVGADQRSKEDEGDFVLELTLDELACVGGGARHDDESPKE